MVGWQAKFPFNSSHEPFFKFNCSGWSRISQTGAPIPKRWTPTYSLANFFPKTASKLQKLDRGVRNANEVGTRRRVLQTYRCVDLSAMTIITTPDFAYVTRLQENRWWTFVSRGLLSVFTHFRPHCVYCRVQVALHGLTTYLNLPPFLQQALYVPNWLCLSKGCLL